MLARYDPRAGKWESVRHGLRGLGSLLMNLYTVIYRAIKGYVGS